MKKFKQVWVNSGSNFDSLNCFLSERTLFPVVSVFFYFCVWECWSVVGWMSVWAEWIGGLFMSVFIVWRFWVPRYLAVLEMVKRSSLIKLVWVSYLGLVIILGLAVPRGTNFKVLGLVDVMFELFGPKSFFYMYLHLICLFVFIIQECVRFDNLLVDLVSLKKNILCFSLNALECNCQLISA